MTLSLPSIIFAALAAVTTERVVALAFFRERWVDEAAQFLNRKGLPDPARNRAIAEDERRELLIIFSVAAFVSWVCLILSLL